jgi:hypothetical protein
MNELILTADWSKNCSLRVDSDTYNYLKKKGLKHTEKFLDKYHRSSFRGLRLKESTISALLNILCSTKKKCPNFFNKHCSLESGSYYQKNKWDRREVVQISLYNIVFDEQLWSYILQSFKLEKELIMSIQELFTETEENKIKKDIEVNELFDKFKGLLVYSTTSTPKLNSARAHYFVEDDVMARESIKKRGDIK